MKHNVAEALSDLMVPVESLTHLPGNPRRSDIQAIAKSYEEFGQLSAIICLRQDDEIMVLAGNHQLMAARDELGWTHIAAAVHDHLSHEQALAFAAIDNHWGDVGGIDEALQYAMLEASGNVAPELFEMIGWDDFELASMESNAVLAAENANEAPAPNAGWTAPEIIAPLIDPDATPEERAKGFEPAVDTDTIVTQGSPSTSQSGSTHAIIQYTLVFDEPEQQTTWYAFLRHLKEDPGSASGTTAEQVIDFIRIHSEID